MKRFMALVMASALAVPGVAAAQSPGPSEAGVDVREVCPVLLVPASLEDLSAASLGAGLVDGTIQLASAEDCPSEEPDPETPTEPGADGVVRAEVGKPVTLTNGDDVVRVTIDSYHFARSYPNGYGGLNKPDKGKLYYAFKISYEAVEGRPSFASYDWEAFAGDDLLDSTYVLGDGPGESLGSGSLPAGRKTSGWLLYQGPNKSGTEVTLGMRAGFLRDETALQLVVECCKPIKGKK